MSIINLATVATNPVARPLPAVTTTTTKNTSTSTAPLVLFPNKWVLSPTQLREV